MTDMCTGSNTPVAPADIELVRTAAETPRLLGEAGVRWSSMTAKSCLKYSEQIVKQLSS